MAHNQAGDSIDPRQALQERVESPSKNRQSHENPTKRPGKTINVKSFLQKIPISRAFTRKLFQDIAEQLRLAHTGADVKFDDCYGKEFVREYRSARDAGYVMTSTFPVYIRSC